MFCPGRLDHLRTWMDTMSLVRSHCYVHTRYICSRGLAPSTRRGFPPQLRASRPPRTRLAWRHRLRLAPGEPHRSSERNLEFPRHSSRGYLKFDSVLESAYLRNAVPSSLDDIGIYIYFEDSSCGYKFVLLVAVQILEDLVRLVVYVLPGDGCLFSTRYTRMMRRYGIRLVRHGNI